MCIYGEELLKPDIAWNIDKIGFGIEYWSENRFEGEIWFDAEKAAAAAATEICCKAVYLIVTLVYYFVIP